MTKKDFQIGSTLKPKLPLQKKGVDEAVAEKVEVVHKREVERKKPEKVELTRFTMDIPREMHKRLKRMCVEREVTLKEYCIAALEAYLASDKQ